MRILPFAASCEHRCLIADTMLTACTFANHKLEIFVASSKSIFRGKALPYRAGKDVAVLSPPFLAFSSHK